MLWIIHFKGCIRVRRQQAFCGDGKFLKGGLHCHTVRSDGRITPEEVLAYVKERGYDFIAFTDHQIYNLKTDYAPETDVVVIPGMEYGNDIEKGHGFRCFHTVCLGPTKEDGNGFEHDQRFAWGTAPNSEEYQPWLDDTHNKNNLTILCHPNWSGTSAKYFETQKGNFAMEIWNTGSVHGNMCDFDAAYWDEILGQGKLIYGVATDDAHSYNDLAYGWVMVNAEKNINSILDALKDGRFYSSCGPEIYDFYVDGDNLHVECSPASIIRIHSDKHPTELIRAEDGRLLTTVDKIIGKTWVGPYDFVRISVVDENGRMAWSNPIILNDKLFSE